jgi:hypothetical protein
LAGGAGLGTRQLAATILEEMMVHYLSEVEETEAERLHRAKRAAALALQFDHLKDHLTERLEKESLAVVLAEILWWGQDYVPSVVGRLGYPTEKVLKKSVAK